MKAYLNKAFDWKSAELTEAYDELPLWSAIPGQLMLEELPYADHKVVVDIGCGTGFPLLLMARRFGPDVQLYGVDSWPTAIARATRKCKAWGLENVTLLEQDAAQIALPDNSVDLITSNLGLLNFEDPWAVLDECHRLLQPNGKLCLTTNLRGTFAEFYAAFKHAVNEETRAKIQQQEDHRHSIDSLKTMLQKHGFVVKKLVESSFTMTYASGTAFLNDYFIVMGFLPSWKAVIPAAEWETVFTTVEASLNAVALKQGHLRLHVPIVYLEMGRALP